MAIKPYLQLVRLPNVFTAAADSLAGWLLVGGSLEEPGRWLPLVAASMAIYAAGIALNDVVDTEIDRRERPDRPLPSGRVSRRFAARLGGLLLALGPSLAALSGWWESLAVASVLAGCALAYDAGLKRTVLGPEVMGACRGLNFLLGMSQSARFGGPSGWLVAGSLALFATGVTWMSRSEAESGRRAGVIGGVILQSLAILGLWSTARHPSGFPAPSLVQPYVSSGGLIVLLAVLIVVNRAAGQAIRRPVPERLQTAVRTGVLSLVWLDVGVVAAVRGPGPALAVALLWVPAFLLGRWIDST
ncbi:MAG TPA: UbiA family prenyltransferase [Isosphaeraceae bacterium]|nr:UbiA family prenyltransferase [Isosphaeraceae bacterium]